MQNQHLNLCEILKEVVYETLNQKHIHTLLITSAFTYVPQL